MHEQLPLCYSKCIMLHFQIRMILVSDICSNYCRPYCRTNYSFLFSSMRIFSALGFLLFAAFSSLSLSLSLPRFPRYFCLLLAVIFLTFCFFDFYYIACVLDELRVIGGHIGRLVPKGQGTQDAW